MIPMDQIKRRFIHHWEDIARRDYLECNFWILSINWIWIWMECRVICRRLEKRNMKFMLLLDKEISKKSNLFLMKIRNSTRPIKSVSSLTLAKIWEIERYRSKIITTKPKIAIWLILWIILSSIIRIDRTIKRAKMKDQDLRVGIIRKTEMKFQQQLTMTQNWIIQAMI